MNKRQNLRSFHPAKKRKESEHQKETKNELRKKLIQYDKKRRSSFMGSLTRVPSFNNEGVDNEGIPIMLVDLFAELERKGIKQIIKASKEALDNGLRDILLGPHKTASESEIIYIIMKAFLSQRHKQKTLESVATSVPRILLAAFFELSDEVSDIVLAVYFLRLEEGWAAYSMLSFILLNRVAQAAISLAMGEPKLRSIEGLLGFKCITDTYRMIRDGPLAMAGSRNLTTMRTFSLSAGLACESIPQMMVQVIYIISTFNSSDKVEQWIIELFIAQIASILFSCLSAGLSLSSLAVDAALHFTIPGQEKHKSCFKFVPRDDKIRQTVVMVSITLMLGFHLILALFGFGTLFANNATLGTYILIGNCIIWNFLRYWVQDVGIYGLDFWFNKTVESSFVGIPAMCVASYMFTMVLPFFFSTGQYIFGCVPFTYSWISSLLIIIISIFVYLESLPLRITIAVILFFYGIAVIAFFQSIDEPWYEMLFTRKPSNWKECLRNELWYLPYHGSVDWGIEELNGDPGANHANHIASYRPCFLPWDKIEFWLISEKESFLESPPLWMTVQWFDNLTLEVKKKVWKEPGELDVLKERVYEVTNPMSFALKASRKIEQFLKKSLHDAKSLPNHKLRVFLQNLKSLNELGLEVYGQTWKERDKEDLVIELLKDTLVIMREKRKERDRQSERSFIAIICFLELLAEILVIANTICLFAEEKNYEGWIFLGALITSKLFQLFMLSYVEEVSLVTFLEVSSGARIITDTRRIMIYGFDNKINDGSRVEIGQLVTLRRLVSGLLQSTPQMIVNLFLMFSLVEHSGEIQTLFWIQMIFIGVTCMSLGISLGKFNHDMNMEFAFEKYYVSMKHSSRAMIVVPKHPVLSDRELRERIRKSVEERRQSFIKSFEGFLPRQKNSQKTLTDIVHVPPMLQALLKRADTLTLREITNEIASLDRDFLLDMFCDSSSTFGEKEYDDNVIVPVFLCAMLMQIMSRNQEERGKANVTRLLTSAFFEAADEVSDIAMSIIFLSDSGNMQWAAIMLMIFMALNRVSQAVIAISFRASLLDIVEGLLGIKVITDTYRLLKYGDK
eukprot:g81.t1